MANEKAEPLKPQAWMVEAAKEWCGLYREYPSHGEMVKALAQIIAAHAPSGSPPAVQFFDCSKCGYYFQTPGPKDRIAPRPTHCPNDGMELVERGSMASQEAPRFHPDVDGTVDDLAVTIVGDVLSGKDGNFVVNRVAARLNALIGLERSRTKMASQEAAQPIPSIADVSDHNPNDPSCKACGSAMGWKCPSCGSKPEPTQEASGKHRPECNYWNGPIGGYGCICAGTPAATEAGTPAKE